MYLWVPMVTWGVVRLVRALIDWRARISYERAREATLADLLRAVPVGVTVWDSHADGTTLCIQTQAGQEPLGPALMRCPGESLADRR